VFAIGGFLVQPYFILKVVDDRGNPLALANPLRAGEESLRVLDPRNAFIMDNMMQDTMRVGTAARAARLGRSDLAGKTGTTNEFVDAWFAGYQPNLVAISWVGFDQPKTLGKNQTGSVVALPIWIGYMERVLKEIPETPRNVPDGVVTAQMQVLPPSTEGGLPPQHATEPKLVPEFFYQESVPPPEVLRPLLDPLPPAAAVPSPASVPPPPAAVPFAPPAPAAPRTPGTPPA
jgi:penicillin-binding protein 1A